MQRPIFFSEIGAVRGQLEKWEDQCSAIEQNIRFLQNPSAGDTISSAEFQEVQSKVSSLSTVLIERQGEMGKVKGYLGFE